MYSTSINLDVTTAIHNQEIHVYGWEEEHTICQSDQHQPVVGACEHAEQGI